MLIPVKHSVAVMIFNGDKVLSVRRPDDDDELPGVWGLPAGILRPSETINDLIGRIGRDKLGVDLTLVCKVASGRQMRRLYLLQMELWEASMAGRPFSLRLRPTGLALRGGLITTGRSPHAPAVLAVIALFVAPARQLHLALCMSCS